MPSKKSKETLHKGPKRLYSNRMKVIRTLLKEKHITVNQFAPAPKLQINMSRLNLMPEAPNGNNLQCELRLNANLIDSFQQTLATLNVSYLVIAAMEEGEVYEQTPCADRIFSVLQSMFIASINELLRETPFPPIPLNLSC